MPSIAGSTQQNKKEQLIMRPISNDTEYPMQPIYLDKDQRPRFEKNPIVDMLCEKHGLNDIAVWWVKNDVEQKYIEQFYQLIGYSVGGYGTLSQVSDESYYRATDKLEGCKNETK